MATKKQSQGLILMELITVIILVGIIASFTSFFLYSGIEGYLKTKNTNAGSVICLDPHAGLAHDSKG